MRDLEKKIVDCGTDVLNSHADRLAACGVSWRGPTIEVWNAEPEGYTSEVRITLLKGGEISDILEFQIYRDGQPLVTIEEVVGWIASQLEQLEGERK